MYAKVRNNIFHYITRASFSSGGLKKMPTIQTATTSAEHQRRNAAGVLDERWYIQLPSKSQGA